ncbi:PAS and ANTAR domain-containing protein [Modestobacter sp. NPDC049651]|uniref:PAS and ANTAR domain-containing protein n=1 Tax=unclassified Modestobacter TaxID=2643866 RepID=UPI0033F2990E
MTHTTTAPPVAARTVTGHPVDLPPNEVLPQPVAVAARFRCGVANGSWWWSPELYQLHGVHPGDRLPCIELLLDHTHHDDRRRVQAAVDRGLQAGLPFAVEHRVVRRDGSVRTAVLFGEPELTADGTVGGVSGLVIDVTDGRVPAGGDSQVRALETEVEQLRTAMASRACIEQAKGVLMLLMGCGDQVAFDLLAHISSHTHRKVREVAASIVSSASGRTPLPADVKEILHDACPPGQPAH